MRCRTAETLISRKIDNELNEHQSAMLDAHIAQCSSCKSMFTENLQVVELIRSNTLPDYPLYMHHRIMANLPQQKRINFFERYKLSYASATLAIFISVYAGTMVGTKSFSTAYDTITENTIEQTSYASFGESSLWVTYDE